MFMALVALLFFGVVHSLMAAFGFKHWVRRQVGPRAYEGFYRLGYNVLSVVTFAPAGLVLLLQPAQVLWTVPNPWAAIFMVIQAVAVLSLILAVLQADPLRFAGISQALAYLRGEPLPLPAEELQVEGFYRLVRHPLYFFSLLALWLIPVMTDVYLGIVIGSTVYFVVGSRLEERRLVREFGATYTSYRGRVPWMLPWPRPRS